MQEFKPFSKVISLDKLPEVVENALSECGCTGKLELYINSIPDAKPRLIQVNYWPPVCDLEEKTPE